MKPRQVVKFSQEILRPSECVSEGWRNQSLEASVVIREANGELRKFQRTYAMALGPGLPEFRHSNEVAREFSKLTKELIQYVINIPAPVPPENFGRSFALRAQRIRQWAEDYDIALPLPYWEALKLRNTGPATVQRLICCGLVLPPGEEALAGLSTLATTWCLRNGLKSRQALHNEVQSQMLYKRRGIGPKIYNEILRWLGAPYPQKGILK